MSSLSSEPETLLRDAAWLERLATRLVDDAASAADLVQDTWLAALRRDWPEGGPPRSWLRRVLRNLAISQSRGERRRQARERQVARSESLPGSDQLVARLQLQHRLTQAVLALDEPARTIVLLRFQEQCSPGEIARRLRLPAGTVRSRLSRSMQRLRGSLAAEGRDLRLTLAPMLGLPGLPIGKAAVLPWSLAMKKSALALTVLILCCAGLWWLEPWGSGTATQAALAGAAEESVPVRSTSSAPPTTATTRQTIPDRSPFGAAAGWWIEGRIRSPQGLGEHPARILVRDAEDKIGTRLHAATDRGGFVELDVGTIFRHPREMLRRLRIEVEHPDHLPRSLQLEISRTQRQAGFRGDRCRLKVDIRLVPTQTLLRGRVQVPPGCPIRAVQVAALRWHPGNRPSRAILDHTHPARDGSFSLRLGTTDPVGVVAWLQDPAHPRWTLRPRHHVTQAGAEQPLLLALSPEAEIRGWLDTGSNPPLVEFWLEAEAWLDEPDNPYQEARRQPKLLRIPGFPGFSGTTLETRWQPIRGRPLPLEWAGDSFEFSKVRAPVGGDGRFSLSGMRPGTEYVVQDVEVRVAGTRLVCFGRGLAKAQHWTPPLDNLRPPLVGQLALARFSLDGRPVATPFVLHRSPPRKTGWVLRRSDAEGRIGTWFGRDQEHLPMTVRIPGCADEDLLLPPNRWTEVALRHRQDAGNLLVELAGDQAREVEGWCVVLRRKSDGLLRRLGLYREDPATKRIGKSRLFTGIQAGRYELEFRPHSRWHTVDFFSFHCPRQAEIEIVAGGTSQHIVTMQRGGFAQIIEPGALAQTLGLGTNPVAYQLLDATGGPIVSQVIYTRPEVDACKLPRAGKTKLSLDKQSRFHPILPPGRYQLELGSGTDRRRLDFRITAGKATSIQPE